MAGGTSHERAVATRRSSAVISLVVRGTCLAAALVSGLLLAPVVLGQAGSPAQAKTTILVSLGLPSEFGFSLSKTQVPPGVVTFELRNDGKLPHTFQLCSKSGTASCRTIAARSIKPGETQDLTVTVRTSVYARLSASSAKRMVEVAVAPAQSAGSTVPSALLPPTTSTTQLTETIGATGPCLHPQSTTVIVTDFDYGFTLVPDTAPCGTVTFIQTNTGQVEHNFDINGSAGHNQGLLGPGWTATSVVTFNPGLYQYYCDFSGHIVLGMIGTFRVT